MARRTSPWTLCQALWTSAVLATGAMGDQVLTTSGFSVCSSEAEIDIEKFDMTYNNDNKTLAFNVAGTSSQVQNVTASISVTAYGVSVFSQKFNPCDAATFIEQLCPLPAGNFAAFGSQLLSAQYAAMIPSIAFTIPDIAAQATLQLDSLDSGSEVACIESEVSNGQTLNLPAISYAAAGMAGAALLLSGISAASGALSGGGAVGTAGLSPGFTEVAGLFQGMAMNGMFSVSYPPIYRNFAQNFAFSTGLVPWTGLLTAIDNFRAATGGNLTDDSVAFLKNATLVFPDGSTSTPDQSFVARRAAEFPMMLAARDTDLNTTVTDVEDSSVVQNIKQTVSGIQAFVEQLSVPKSDVFMTALLVVAILIAIIVAGILLIKVVLEFWALFGSFPKSLTGFRKHYWRSIARTVTSLILLLYGVWVMYCVYQFTLGDSWAAKALAAVTLTLFTGLLAFFSYKIWSTARKLKAEDGDASRLYNDKSIWVKYSMFYQSYRQDAWWLFVPAIAYMLAKSCVLAAGNGSGMVQTIVTFVIETLMLGLLLWSRPFVDRSANVINIVIQVVRVLSTVCIFIFVEEFGIAQTTQTVTGVVMIVVQSTLSGTLAILMAWNAIRSACRTNPHRKRRKDLEKLRDMDALTPLDARNSLLLNHSKTDLTSMYSISGDRKSGQPPFSNSPERYYPTADAERSSKALSGGSLYRPLTPAVAPNEAAENLIHSAAPVGMGGHSRESSLGQEEYGASPPEYGAGHQASYNYGNAGYRGY